MKAFPLKKVLTAAALLLLALALLCGGVFAAEAVPAAQETQAVSEFGQTITYMTVIACMAYILAEFLKVKAVPTKYIPFLNASIGVAAALICYFTGIMPTGTPMLFVQDLVACLFAAMGAGGTYDMLATNTKAEQAKTQSENPDASASSEAVG